MACLQFWLVLPKSNFVIKVANSVLEQMCKVGKFFNITRKAGPQKMFLTGVDLVLSLRD